VDRRRESVNAEGLSVEPWAKASGQRSEMNAMVGDAQIKQAVRDAFVYDRACSRSIPSVEVGEQRRHAHRRCRQSQSQARRRAGCEEYRRRLACEELLKTRPAKPITDDKLAQDVDAACCVIPSWTVLGQRESEERRHHADRQRRFLL